MNTNHALGVLEVKGRAKRVEINPKRVAEWALIFTNVFFIFYFLGRLFQIF
jgi:hypothetical protein